ncbi:MAG: NADH-quinone oxidoreductase subunit NuoE [Sedimentisphaerales bacterium]|jgi:NADH-quinone oxidoreductase subunit E
MLTTQEMKEIEEELGKYAQKRAVGPEALKIVQRHRDWISDESLTDIARFLDMTEEELDSVATCYNLIFRKPVGKHVILMCDSVSCWVMGHEDLFNHLTQRLGITFGETTSNGRFTLLPVACLGACDHAPAMMVDETLYVDLTVAKLGEILDRYK